MKNHKALPLTNRNEWRKWLAKNHDRENEIWLVFYKRRTGKPGILYPEALEEALCFGWIDGKLKRIDDKKHIRACLKTPDLPRNHEILKTRNYLTLCYKRS